MHEDLSRPRNYQPCPIAQSSQVSQQQIGRYAIRVPVEAGELAVSNTMYVAGEALAVAPWLVLSVVAKRASLPQIRQARGRGSVPGAIRRPRRNPQRFDARGGHGEATQVGD